MAVLLSDDPEPKVHYFDEYEQIHQQMNALRLELDDYPILSDEAYALRARIAELREKALELIPYGATGRNRTWNGRRA